MATAPSLGELTNIRPEATVNPGVILDSRDAVHELNEAARFNADMTQRRYELGLSNLKGIYQDLGAIQETPVMQQDRPILAKKMSDVLNIIAEDPRAALGGPKFADIQRRIGELRTLSTNSKQDNIYNDFHEKAIQSDPELNTSGNRAKMDTFASQPVGQRSKFLLDTPVKFDPEAAMGNILKQKQVAVPYAGTSFEGVNNEWIVRETGTTYQREPALKLWNQGYFTGTDPNNQPIQRWAAEQFEKIKDDPEQMRKFGNPKDPKEFYENLGKIMYGANQDIVGEKTSTRVANPYTMLSHRQNFQLYMEAIKEGNREKLAAVKKNLELGGAPENANFLLRQYANIAGNTTGKQQRIDDKAGVEHSEDIIDVPEDIKKKFVTAGRTTVKEGVGGTTETITESNAPDLFTRTANGDLRAVYLKRYTEDDKMHNRIPKGKSIGDVVVSSKGDTLMKNSTVIPKRDLMAQLGKGIVQTKILTASIDQADKALQKDPNAIIDRVNSGDDDGTVIEQAHQTSKKEPSAKTYSLKGKKYTQAQVEAAAKKSGLSVEEYAKQIGLK